MALTLPEFSRKMLNVSRVLSGAESQKVFTRVGELAVRDARSALPPDLGGDHKFSGWKADLNVKATRHRSGPGITVHPDKMGAGPWKVAQRGRNQGETGLFLGPGINRQTGLTARTKSGAVRKQRARKGRRWNGRTAGKGTWTEAVSIMNRKLPNHVRSAMAKLVVKALQ